VRAGRQAAGKAGGKPGAKAGGPGRRAAGALAAAWAALPEAVIAWDAGGTVALANPAAHRLLGAAPEGQPLARWLPGLGLAPGADGTVEAEAARADGSRFPAELVLGAPPGAGLACAVLRDLGPRRRREAELALGEQRLRDFAETASDWLWETGPDHRFTYVSDPALAAECLGRARVELAQREPGDEPAWEEHHADLGARRPFRDFLHVLSPRSGGTRYMSVSGRPVLGPDGAFLGYRGSATDITEAVLWRRMRAETEIRLKAILDAAVDGILTVSVTGSIESVNPAAELVFGYRANEVIGRSLRMLIPDAWAPGGGPAAMVGAGRVIDGLRESGERFPLELSVSEADLAEEGRFYVAILRDVTERRRVEQELQNHREHLENLVELRAAALVESEARLRAILAHSVVPLVVAGEEDGDLRFANDAAERLFGFGGGGVAGQSDEALYERPEDRDAVMAGLRARGRLIDHEVRLRTRSGGGFWAALSAIRMRFDDAPSVLMTCVDISRRKESEFAMAAALEKEKALNEQQQRFFSMASHEFRTPLTIIDAVTQMLARFDGAMDADERRQEYDNIRAAVARMTNLMESVLSASRAEAGTLRLNLAELDLQTLVREAVKRQALISPDHRIDLDIAALPSTIRGDARLLDQVLANLLSNAVKYSPEPRSIRVVGRVSRPEGGRGAGARTAGGRTAGDGRPALATIEVRDRGIGIPKAELPRIFQKYFRASTGATIAGTGIGLHLVKLIVELHGGTVGVDSAEGVGTAFAVSLPVGGPAVDAA
jgi:PAS domain S-box-containing protein